MILLCVSFVWWFFLGSYANLLFLLSGYIFLLLVLTILIKFDTRGINYCWQTHKRSVILPFLLENWDPSGNKRLLVQSYSCNVLWRRQRKKWKKEKDSLWIREKSKTNICRLGIWSVRDVDPHHTEAELLISNDVSHIGLQILWTFSLVFFFCGVFLFVSEVTLEKLFLVCT